MQPSSQNHGPPAPAALETIAAVLIFTVVLATLLRCTPPAALRRKVAA